MLAVISVDWKTHTSRLQVTHILLLRKRICERKVNCIRFISLCASNLHFLYGPEDVSMHIFVLILREILE